MGYNANAAIAKMRAGKGNTIYSMNYRQNNNPRMRDCSSAIAEALLAGGVNVYYSNGQAPNTVGMLYMEGKQLKRITEAQAGAGDICVMGGKGGNGAAGHVFMMTSDSDEVECTPSGANMAGVEGSPNAINELDYGYLKNLGWQMDWFRPTSDGNRETDKPVVPETGKVDQVLNIGEHFKAKHNYRVDKLVHAYGIDQVVSNELAGGSDASVLNNGLNVESVIKTDKNGNVTKDQFINVGDHFKLRSDRIPVVDVDEATNGVAFGTRSGIVWASASTLTEVK